MPKLSPESQINTNWTDKYGAVCRYSIQWHSFGVPLGIGFCRCAAS
jgi:hypothetical protein